MELNKAIEVVKNIDTTDIHCKNCVLEEKDKCITDLFGYSCQRIAIDTVLEELNNSISKDKIENKIKELKEKLENVRNKEDRIRNGVAIIVLEYCIDSMNELLNK